MVEMNISCRGNNYLNHHFISGRSGQTTASVEKSKKSKKNLLYLFILYA